MLFPRCSRSRGNLAASRSENWSRHVAKVEVGPAQRAVVEEWNAWAKKLPTEPGSRAASFSLITCGKCVLICYSISDHQATSGKLYIRGYCGTSRPLPFIQKYG